MLRSIEQKIEAVVERTFGRAFRSRLQPVELARKLAREMEHHKTVSVSRVYVPNEFTVFLSPTDREEFVSLEPSLAGELALYLTQHAKAEGLSLVAEPHVKFETDSDLRVGEFGIACRMAEAPPDPEVATRGPAHSRPSVPPPVAPSATPTPPEEDGEEDDDASPPPTDEPDDLPDEDDENDENDEAHDDSLDDEVEDEPAVPPIVAGPVAPPVAPPVAGPPTRVHEGLAAVSGTQVFDAGEAADAGVPRETLTLVTPEGRRRVTKRVARLGRSRDCDIVIDDANVSRRHAEIRHVGLDYVIVDLNSTNGIEINGELVSRQALADGDTLVIGTTTLTVELS